MWGLLLVLTAFLLPGAAGDHPASGSDSVTLSGCRTSYVAWKSLLPCGVHAEARISLPHGCPQDVCSFTVDTDARGLIEYPGPYELSTLVTIGQGIHFAACLGANKEQNDLFSQTFPEYFPCPQTCRDNGFGWGPICQGSMQGTIVIPEGECDSVTTHTSFGYTDGGRLAAVGFWICHEPGGRVGISPAPWNG